MNNLPELLAPAGDQASLRVALDSGADAVYLGIGVFNMRRAVIGNFTLENLPEAATLCREKNVKLYLTVNTLVYESELDDLRELLTAARPWIDAAIVSDLAAIGLCRELAIPIHISTQMSCANSMAATALAGLGAERIVLARECTLSEISEITKKTGVPIEVFAHGAQCVAESGRCFLSQEAYGFSANRGECRQPCRREYHIQEVRDGEGSDAAFMLGSGFLLSARDICTLPFLDKVVASGVTALKIEGRARNPEYVKTVVGAYRRGLDAIAAGEWTDALAADLVKETERVYHRPFSSGLLLGRPGENQFAETAENQATEKKIYVGVVLNYYKTPGVVHVLVHDHALEPGDHVAIHGPSTGIVEVIVEELRQDEVVLSKAVKGDWCTFAAPRHVRVNDKVYRVVLADADPSAQDAASSSETTLSE